MTATAVKNRKMVLGAVLVLINLPVVLVLLEAVSFHFLNRNNGTIVSSGREREYLLHVPRSYDRTKPTPLVISMHGAAMWPAAQMDTSQWNTVADEEGFIVVRGVDERLPVLRVETWRDHLDASLDIWLYRAGARVFSAFGGIALLLAVIGVYGIKSYVVSRRTREFGIRLAIGARPRVLLWQVLREGSRITTVGIGIGLLLALGAGQVLQGILYGVDGFEPVVLVTAALILFTSSLLASYIPARRATKVDPTVALRSE